MPPMIVDEDARSESDDSLDAIPAKPVKKPTPKPVKQKVVEEIEEDDIDEANDGAEDDESDDGSAEPEYAVEKILTHGFLDDGTLTYKVKWVGYEEEADMTWEQEDNLVEGASEVLAEYIKKIGGRPKYEAKNKAGPKGSPKKRKSEAMESPAPEPSAKRGRRAKANGKTWEAPSGSWEDRVKVISTIIEDSKKDKSSTPSTNLTVFLIFDDDHKASYPMGTVRLKCPQKLIDYYEQHLTFRDVNDDVDGRDYKLEDYGAAGPEQATMAGDLRAFSD